MISGGLTDNRPFNIGNKERQAEYIVEHVHHLTRHVWDVLRATIDKINAVNGVVILTAGQYVCIVDFV
jgi:hypothetical protein